MIDLDEIEEQVARREMGDTSWANCQSLAILYTILDHNRGYAAVRSTSAPSGRETTGDLGDSEFLRAASGVDVGKLMSVIDEHMQAVRVVFPKEYDSVISKIRAM